MLYNNFTISFKFLIIIVKIYKQKEELIKALEKTELFTFVLDLRTYWTELMASEWLNILASYVRYSVTYFIVNTKSKETVLPW